MLGATLGIFGPSLYAAFGTSNELFDEAVRSYALRYGEIYDRALSEPTASSVIRRLLLESGDKFTCMGQGHPGRLTSSAVMSDASFTLDVRTYVADLQRADEARVAQSYGPPRERARAVTIFRRTRWAHRSISVTVAPTATRAPTPSPP